MNFKKLAGDTVFAFISQGAAFLASFTMSMLVPKLLGVTEFGYWQLFLFYTSYVGFFGLGSIDGLYLSIGGTCRRHVNKRDVLSQLLCSTGMVFIFACAFILLSWFTVNDDKRLVVILFTAVYAVLSHLVGSFGLVFQSVNETRLYSTSVIIDRLSFLCPLLALLVLRTDVFEPYAIAYICSKLIALIFCMSHAKDFIFAGLSPLATSIKQTLGSIKIGFSLMIAGIADMLILGVARALVDHAWGIETFGKVSFALSLVNFFIAFVSQASMVLFPALRQGTEHERRRFYSALKNFSEIVFPAAYLLYSPAVWALSIWLPQYAVSMRYFALLLPICVFNTKMDICCTTYFKVLREERLLLSVNLITTCSSAMFSFIGVYVLGSLDAVLIGVVICVIGRSLWSEHHLDKVMHMKSEFLALEELLLTVLFISTSLLFGRRLSLVFYAFGYCVYLLINKQSALELKANVIRLLKK